MYLNLWFDEPQAETADSTLECQSHVRGHFENSWHLNDNYLFSFVNREATTSPSLSPVNSLSVALAFEGDGPRPFSSACSLLLLWFNKELIQPKQKLEEILLKIPKEYRKSETKEFRFSFQTQGWNNLIIYIYIYIYFFSFYIVLYLGKG